MSANETTDVYEIARELRDAVGDMKGSIEKRLRALERGGGGEGFAPEDVATARVSMLGGHGGGAMRGFASWLQGIVVESDPVKGGYLVPPEHASEVWEMIAPASIGLESGFTVIPTSSDELHLPTVTDDAASWVAEATAIPQTDPLIGEVVARPRKIGAYVELSNELVSDSTPAALQVVSDSFTRALGRTLDQGFFVGPGTAPQILGLFNKPGITAVPGGGAIVNLDSIVSAIAALEARTSPPPASTCTRAHGRITSRSRKRPGHPAAAHRHGRGRRRRPALDPGRPRLHQLPAPAGQDRRRPGRSGGRRPARGGAGGRAPRASARTSAMRAISRWDIALPNAKAFVAITGVSGVTPIRWWPSRRRRRARRSSSRDDLAAGRGRRSSLPPPLALQAPRPALGRPPDDVHPRRVSFSRSRTFISTRRPRAPSSLRLTRHRLGRR